MVIWFLINCIIKIDHGTDYTISFYTCTDQQINYLAIIDLPSLEIQLIVTYYFTIKNKIYLKVETIKFVVLFHSNKNSIYKWFVKWYINCIHKCIIYI